MITQTACRFGLVSLLLAVSSAALAQTPANPEPGQSGPALGAPAGLVIFPKNRQSPGQQAPDRSSCHSRALGPTRFAPSQPSTARSVRELATRPSHLPPPMTG